MQHQNVMQNLARPETRHVINTLTGEKMEFRIIHWNPTTVFSRIPLIGRYFGVPLSMLINTQDSQTDISEVLPAALIQLFNTMEEHDIMFFISQVLEDVMYENMPVMDKFNEIFMKNPSVVIELVAKVVEIHYAPFFKTGFSNLISSLMPVVNLNKN